MNISQDLVRNLFEGFFGALEGFSDEDIRGFTDALQLLNDRLLFRDEPEPEMELITGR